jgi:hypothetical protein
LASSLDIPSTRKANPDVLRAYAGLILLVLIAALAAFAGTTQVQSALELHQLAVTANPYFVPERAVLLYLAVPAATIGLALFVMAPGLLLAAGTGADKGAAEWLLTGLALSMALLVPATTVAQLATGTVLRGPAFLALVALVTVAVLPFPLWRLASGRMPALNLGGQWADLAFALIVPVAVLLVFSAKFYWENFTPDGSGGLQFARLFTATLWPFWPESAGSVAKAPGLSSMLFVVPGSWFLRTLGEYEYAVRAPMLLFLGLLHPVLVALIRVGRSEPVQIVDHLLIGGILILYTLALVYSGGYHPWFNDSPMPAVRETLTLVAFLGYVLFLVKGRVAWMAVFAFLSFLSIPTGAMWILLLPLAIWLVWSPGPRPAVKPALAVFIAIALFAIAAPLVIRALGLPIPGGEFDVRSVADRLRYVSLADWERILYLLVPGGIVPALALFAWKRQDGLSRSLTLTTAIIFLFFWFQAYRVLLHHFVPAMLLPLIVYWRSFVLPSARSAIPRLAVLAGLAVATWLAWPVETRLHSADRELGSKIVARGPVFDGGPKAPAERFRGFDPVALDVMHELLRVGFPQDYSPQAPAEKFFGGPHVWYYYSEFPKPAGHLPNYEIRPLNLPGQGTRVAQYRGYGLFIRDMQEYQRDRTRKLPFNTGAPLLATNRDVIFGSGARTGERTVIDLVVIPRTLFGWPPRRPADPPPTSRRTNTNG